MNAQERSRQQAISFTVHGTAATQGSMRGVVHKATKRVVVFPDQSKKLRTWRGDVREAAVDAMRTDPLDGSLIHAPFEGAVSVTLVFYLPRPKSVSVKQRPYPSVRPDADKLARGTLDALKSAGVYHDDAQVCALTVRKSYTEAMPPRAIIWVSTMEE